MRTLGLIVLALTLAAEARAAIGRDQDPVSVSGAALPELSGRSLAELALFRYDPPTGTFVPIPFQLDERVDHGFNVGSANEFHETIYDVFGEDDGALDDNDELTFLYGDAGPAAPASAPWVAGSDATRHEIIVADPRAGAPAPERRAYLFTGPSLPHAQASYIAWNGSASGSVSSPVWSIDFSDRWVLNGYRVFPPCGGGDDLIDRVKGRAGSNLSLESEQDWNLTSTYLGGVVGPVRAIRYVKGAASGVNTVHHDVIYPAFWERVVNLRVHPIARVALYIDLLPRVGTSVFTSRFPGGVSVDGLPDAGVSGSFESFAVVSGPSGGYVSLYDVPVSPLYGSRQFYYRDDASYDDALRPAYDDDDDSSFGSQGIDLRDLNGSATQAISFALRFYPLCDGIGDAALGTAYQELRDEPLQVAIAPQTQGAGAVRTLAVSRQQADVVLDWDAVPGATAYRIYASASADLPHASWTPLGDTSATGFIDAGAGLVAQPRFYSIVGLTGAIEGAW